MSDAKVKFFRDDEAFSEAAPGQEQLFEFDCPRRLNKNGRCGFLFIAGRTDLKRDGQGKNGGVAQWDWDGNREAPTFAPSVNCGGCWHGYIRAGRCVTAQGAEEPGATP